MEPIIKNLTPTQLVGMRLKMSLSDNKTFLLWNSFMPRRKEIKNSISTDLYSMQVYDASYFDNFSLDAEFTKWAAVAVDDSASIPEGMEAYGLKGGDYAVFMHKGGPAEGAKVFDYIFQTWLPASDYVLDQREHFELLGSKYKNNDPDSEEEIWIPVKLKKELMDKTKIAVGLFDKLAKSYQTRCMDVSLYSDSFNRFCDSIAKQDAALLELACGPGNVTKYLLDKRPDFKMLGTDLAPRMLELARANNPTAVFELMDCKDLGKVSETYDGIVCAFCLPYLSKEETAKLLQDASKVLASDGVLFLSTMEDDYEKSGWEKASNGEEVFMHYHKAEFLVAELKYNGFIIIDQQRKFTEGRDGAPVTDLLLIARKA
ncbi:MULTISPECIES: GyrI-like domain-containing protein [unclassified Flavobacterium]|uniref:GyrI-like domain-containing protein n=1 Tax=unclassified Flavobacterium TaxID=196869 RepID=UPI0029CAB711|nr:GyrI-like domain-containing protein [Flavobacterium sp. N2550]